MTALLRSIDNPTPHAVGDWNLGEVAMHLSQAWVVVPGLTRCDLSRAYEVVPKHRRYGRRRADPGHARPGDTTTLGVQSDPERDPAVLADRIETQAQEYFSECAGADPDAPRPWLVQGTTVRQSTLTYHLLNETVMHGYDIAHAAGRKWRIEPAHAAMALGRFVIPIIGVLDPRALANGTNAAGVQATYDVRIRGADRFHFVFNDASVRVEEPSPCRVDCYISADPAAFLMVIWARQGQWSAISTGRLMAWGRKPWLGPQLRPLMRNP